MKRGWFGPKALGAFSGWPSAAPRTIEGWLATLVFIALLAWAIIGLGLTTPERWVLGVLDAVVFLTLTRVTYVDDEDSR